MVLAVRIVVTVGGWGKRLKAGVHRDVWGAGGIPALDLTTPGGVGVHYLSCILLMLLLPYVYIKHQ